MYKRRRTYYTLEHLTSPERDIEPEVPAAPPKLEMHWWHAVTTVTCQSESDGTENTGILGQSRILVV